MNLPKPKLKLIHNALFLVSAPLAFGMIMTMGLNSTLQQTLQLRKSTERSAIASSSINKLVSDCVEFRSDLIQIQYLKNQLLKSRLEPEVRQVRNDLKNLTELMGKNAQYEQQLKEIVPAAKNTLALVERSQQAVFAHHSGAIDDSESALQTDLDTSIENLRTLAENHAQLLPLDSETAKQHARSVPQFLAWLLAANFVVCPLLVLYFSQNVVRRLRVLVANSERLAQQKELLQPIEGDDEIAHLDKVFRSMAKTITEARAEREEIEQLKKDFITMISHDLRTPLSAVQGTLTLIADGVYGTISDSGVSKAKVAEESIGRLTNLANELLDIERLESKQLPIDLKPTQLQSAIQRSMESIQGFALYKKIEIQSAETDLIVMADEERLIQVIVNLLSNAIKFSADGSTVSVATSMTESGQVEVRVTDQGRGISPAMSKEIFDRFRQVEKADADNERGMGLGLAICKAIVSSHKGEIGVDSNDGKGCSFWFRLPPVAQNSVLKLARQEVR